MPRNPTIPCAGGCGKLLWEGKTSLPAGEATCRDCRRLTSTFTRPCEHCGVSFTTTKPYLASRRFCGLSCAMSRPRPGARKLTPGMCGYCGDEFTRTNSKHMYCSTDCASKHVTLTIPWHQCGACDTWIAKPGRTYCSDGCRAVVWFFKRAVVPRQRQSCGAEYMDAHRRVRKELGPASEQLCVECGGPAFHWSYNHADPDERTDDRCGHPYSDKPMFYEPRCVPCHRFFDADTDTDVHEEKTPSKTQRQELRETRP
jgi:hypothetical protein